MYILGVETGKDKLKVEGILKMLDIKFVKENPELVKENIRKKFKENRLPLVDEAIRLYDEKARRKSARRRTPRKPQQNKQADRRAYGKGRA